MRTGLICLLAVAMGTGAANASTVSFGDLPSGTIVTDQYAGITVSGGAVVNGTGAGNSGGELENLTLSGIQINFTDIQSWLTGSYTAAQTVTMSTYDAGGNLIQAADLGPTGGQSSLFFLSGGAIASLSITSDAGADFLIDDLSYSYTAQPVKAADAPEPGGLLLMGTGFFGAAALSIYRASLVRRSAQPELGGAGLA